MSALTLDIVRGPRAASRVHGPEPMAAYVSRRRTQATHLADRMLANARDAAERLICDANAAVEQIHAAARDEGRLDGERQWAEAALALAERRDEALANLERDCVNLALEIARQIVVASVAIDATLVDEIAARACEPLRRDAALVVRMAPCHAARADEIRARLGETRVVTFEVDETLGSADCVAECAGIRVDARLDVQLAAVALRLLREPAQEAGR